MNVSITRHGGQRQPGFETGSANKEYGTGILIGQATYECVREQFLCRELDRIRVKGRTEPVTIYELIGRLPADESPPHGLAIFQ